MKINLAKSRGFCFGVRRALDIATKTLQSNRRVFMLGDIVHNEEVVKKMRKAGIKKIKNLTRGENRIFLLRAHGTPVKIINKAKLLGYKIVDATCPMVKEIHKIAKDMENKGYVIIVIGDKKHDEVQGIIGQLKHKAIVIEDQKNIPFKKIKKIKKAVIVVQSTQNLYSIKKIVYNIRSHIQDLKFFNTICTPTRIKQEEIKKMPQENDVMIIIGSKYSANTKRLYEISKSLNPKSYWVSSKKDIKQGWFNNAKNVGITAGASTPDYITEDIVKYLKQIN